MTVHAHRSIAPGRHPAARRSQTAAAVLTLWLTCAGIGHAQRASNTAADWPLTFNAHNFGVLCLDTLACRVVYDRFPFGSDRPTSPAASLSPALREQVMIAGYGPVLLDRPPAEAKWKSRDGTELTARIDIADIFRDRLIRHNLTSDEIPDGVSIGTTDIILEIDDRTINVHIRTFIPTKREQIPGNSYSNFRDDVFKVWSRTF